MYRSRSFPTSLLLLLLLLPQRAQAEIQKLYQEQLQILEQRLQENQEAQRLNPHNTRLKREGEDIQIAILSLRRQMLREQEQRQREQQREQERQKREQQRELYRRERRQATLAHLEDLLYLQEKELERLLEEYQQLQPLYPLGMVPEHHWHRIQRQINMQKERVRRTQTRIQDLSR